MNEWKLKIKLIICFKYFNLKIKKNNIQLSTKNSNEVKISNEKKNGMIKVNLEEEKTGFYG